MSIQRHDIIIVGSGLSALALVLKLPKSFQIALITKGDLKDSNSYWAQGGVAAVDINPDSYQSHEEDTFVAGASLGLPDVIREVVRQAPERIQDLKDWGVQFTSSLHLEGGHSHRRIHHVEDHTGQSIQETLIKKIKELPNVQIFEHFTIIDLILEKKWLPRKVGPSKVLGVFTFDQNKKEVVTFIAPATVLATGGLGRLYRFTSNWRGATGDGIAAAFRAGCRLANMEFIQFHPTLLYHQKSRNFLISEALRGEGAKLINVQGSAFMKAYHPLADLAPRDIVSRSIYLELKRSGAPCVYLDVTHLGRETLMKKFPAIYRHCQEIGLDISETPIPVIPGAHYSCGGVLTHLDGQTDLLGLWVLGESACTGLHGANRLASNSLLECLVMAHQASFLLKKHIPDHQDLFHDLPPMEIPRWKYPQNPSEVELALFNHLWDEIRETMWDYVGIVRSQRSLIHAWRRLTGLYQEVSEYYEKTWVSHEIIELRNLVLNGLLVVRSALKRKESRGAHYNIDYPELSLEARETIISLNDWLKNPVNE